MPAPRRHTCELRACLCVACRQVVPFRMTAQGGSLQRGIKRVTSADTVRLEPITRPFGPWGPNHNNVCRRLNITQQNQSLPVSKLCFHIALGPIRPPAGLGDYETALVRLS